MTTRCQSDRNWWKGTVTGRTPSQPNIQNIPIRTPEGQAIREAFVRDASPEMENDPCDEMVTVGQVVSVVVRKLTMSPYDRAAAILGVSREEAKRAIYKHSYGG